MARIVVVDDDPDIRGMLVDYFGSIGHSVMAVADGAGLDRDPAARQADLYVVDLGLPGEDGFALTRRLRADRDAGIVMLTGASDTTERIVGLEVGADDYVTKPVDLPELAARIAAILRRRRSAEVPEGCTRFGRYLLDLRAWELRDEAGRPVELRPMEIDLVAAFATRPGRVLSRDDLLHLAPARGDDPFDRSIDHRVTRLRRKLERDPAHPELIKTVRGAGYLFAPG
ncbi:response regulator [Rubellimicrobium arenae]|uniref:response regulator n=1 Tax=Rubellimicrobium arenae TaxID=2817372 RepID=UPI0034A10D95